MSAPPTNPAMHQAAGLSRSRAGAAPVAGAAPPAFSVAFVSGKGGVGKTNLAANLGVAAAAMQARAIVIDGDLGLANIDVLLGLTPRHNAADVLAGRCDLPTALLRGPRGMGVLPAGADCAELACLDRAGAQRLVRLVEAAPQRFDLVLVDAGAGIGPAVIGLASVCQLALLVLSPEPTSLADAYATCKLLWRRAPDLPVEVVVNGARSEREGRAAFANLERMTQRFLRRDVALRAIVPEDARLRDAVARQRAVVEAYPGAPASRRITRLADELLSRARRAAAPLAEIGSAAGVSEPAGDEEDPKWGWTVRRERR